MCEFWSLGDKFDFGMHDGESLGEVLMYHPSYVTWCNKNVDPGICSFEEEVIEEIRYSFPDFPLDADFMEQWSYNTEVLDARADMEYDKWQRMHGDDEETTPDPYEGIDWAEEEWDALTDGQYGPYPGGDIDYDVFGF